AAFREDLYYRLNVVRIALPPLRDRREDIPLLVDHFLVRFNARLKKQVRRLEEEAMARLMAHSWPGSIRELENVIERTVLFCDRDVASVSNLPEEFGGMASPPPRLQELPITLPLPSAPATPAASAAPAAPEIPSAPAASSPGTASEVVSG